MMLALSSRSPNARKLIETTSELARQLNAQWFVVHVRQPPTLHFRAPASEYPVPTDDLAFARKTGATVTIEIGTTVKALVAFARRMSIDYFVTGRSKRSPISLRWRLPLAEEFQRKLPNTILMIV